MFVTINTLHWIGLNSIDHSFSHSSQLPLVDGGAEPFFRMFIKEGLNVKLGFWVGIGFLSGGDFFLVGLEKKSLYKN